MYQEYFTAVLSIRTIADLPGGRTVLSASAKILLYIVFSFSLFLVENNVAALCLLAASLALLFLPGMRGGIVPISLFLLATLLGNLFFHPGRILLEAGPLSITDESLRVALVRTARVSGLIAGAKVLTAKTPVVEILGVLERFFLPLERIRVPVSEFFETAALTFRLLPGIRARAVESYRDGVSAATGGGLLSRARIAATLVLPLMIKIMQSPEELLPEKEIVESGMEKTVKGAGSGSE